MRRALLILLVLLPLRGLALPPGFSQTEIGDSWNQVAGLAFSEDGSRLYVVERGGVVWLVENGVRLPTPFLDISDEVGGWRDFGLLGFALHPNFDVNGLVFALYVVDRYHLFNAGQPGYDPGLLESQQRQATIGRISRFTADPATGLRTVLPGSQVILLGATPDDGIPILHESHGTGQLVFGQDGTLLATNGDGASYSSTDVGDASETYHVQAIADGILEPWENVGAYRSQLVEAYNGNVLRIDPVTGAGIPSNPWYDPAAPTSVRSRSFAVGLRNPYRFAHRPGTGSHDPADGDPGVFYIGDVGWASAEDLQILSQAGQNFGWPAFEGLVQHSGYTSSSPAHPFAPNPLFGDPAHPACSLPFLRIRDLIVQESPSPSWPNPCDAGIQIPDQWIDPSDASVHVYRKFEHARPPISWRSNADTATVDASGNATVTRLGSAGSPVIGSNFSGNASTGGVWYTGTDFPAPWRDTYFHADYGAGWIKNFVFDAQDVLLEVRDFVDPGNNVTFVATNPVSGGIYYVKWGDRVREIRYTGDGNTPPFAVAGPAQSSGPSPLQIQFTGSGSFDIDPGDTLTYLWDFGDGAFSSDPDPTHTFTSGVLETYTVRLTVTDGNANVDDAEVLVSINNSPPSVQIDAPVDGSLYTLEAPSIQTVSASIDDAEHLPGELACALVVELVHNEHTHPEPTLSACGADVEITPVGCDGSFYAWRFTLTVTDPGGLSSSDVVEMLPDCSTAPNQPPLAVDDFVQVAQGLATAVDVLANDSDVDGDLDPASVAITLPPLFGSTTVDPLTGQITYTHDGSPNLEDDFTYTVDDDDGATSGPATVYLSAFNNPPTATVISPAHGSTWQPGEQLVLEAHGMDPEEGMNVGFEWHVDAIVDDQLLVDVFTWSGPTPPLLDPAAQHPPGSAVSYLIRVDVSDSVGAQTSASVRVNPASPPPGNPPPLAGFSALPALGPAPLDVQLDAGASSDPGGEYLTASWDFGDGETGTGLVTGHTWAAEGNYVATLTVTDAAGQTATASLLIEVSEPGLTATYVNSWSTSGGTLDLSSPALVRTDPVIDFNWGSGSPDPAVGSNDFGARWEGSVRTSVSGDHRFYPTTDDGVRLWLDGVLQIDDWTPHAPEEQTGPLVFLEAGTWYPIAMEFFENGGGAVAQLRWEGPGIGKQIVPAASLAPLLPGNQGPAVVDDLAAVAQAGQVVIDVLANDVDEKDEIDPTSLQIVQGASAGSLAVDAGSGLVTYTHGGGAGGSDTFTYTIADLEGAVSREGRVTLSVDVPPPSIQILSPAPGSTVVGPDVTVTYQVGGDPTAYDHLHLTLDDPPHVTILDLTGSHALTGVAWGPHLLTAQLATAGHVAVADPGARQQISFTVVPPAVCGDGVVEQDEQCDDGNLSPGDCCSATCGFEPADAACAADLELCTRDVCDGAGSCVHPPEPDGLACDDTDACTAPDQCAAGSCSGAALPDLDGDGSCDLIDDDDDGDGVADAGDADPLDPTICADADGDGCDDCSSGTVDPAADGADADADGACDAGDNCPFAANDQADTAGVAGGGPDGIGDACQCGDLTLDGGVDAADPARLRAALADPGGAAPTAAELQRCSVSGGDTSCDLVDAVALRRALAGAAPGLAQSCPAALP